jgi:hypothetical protein
VGGLSASCDNANGSYGAIRPANRLSGTRKTTYNTLNRIGQLTRA